MCGFLEGTIICAKLFQMDSRGNNIKLIGGCEDPCKSIGVCKGCMLTIVKSGWKV